MKIQIRPVLATLVLLSTLSLQPATVFAQGTAFTYQGRLTSGTNVANGSYDLTFTLFGANTGGSAVAGPITNTPTAVSNGLFTVTLDFGANFPGADRFLEIAVRTTGGGAFTNLSPRQKLTPAPYAITASNLTGTLPASQLSGTLPSTVLGGTYAGTVTLNNPANSFTGNGTGLTSVNATTLGGLGAANFWIVGGNTGTGGASLGTGDSQPLKLIAGNRRVLQLETKSVSLGGFDSLIAVNTLGGASGNVISNGVIGGTIAGGGVVTNHLLSSEAGPNTVLDNFGTVGGGLNNTAGYADTDFDNARAATVAGGEGNTASSAWATVGGGQLNTASGELATVGGGQINTAIGAWSTVGGGAVNTTSDIFATVGGGYLNTSSGESATVPGGYGNLASGASSFAAGFNNTASGDFATVPGGRGNLASGTASFAAGKGAQALHDGTFVWADLDPSGNPYSSTGTNQFCVRAWGGIQVDPQTSMFFGSQTRQMLNLFGTDYGLGVQFDSLYFRCVNYDGNSGFSWYKGGVHNDGYAQPGTGGIELMHLIDGGLYVHGTFVNSSDRNVKQDFAEVNSRAVLEKVAQLPIQTWAYKNDPKTKHLGPVAQDFYAAFAVGPDDKHITTVDESGVALAAIQGLNQKLNEKDAEIQQLKQRLDKLETLISNSTDKQNGGEK